MCCAYTHIYVYMLSHYVAHLKLTHYKSTTLQFLKKRQLEQFMQEIII